MNVSDYKIIYEDNSLFRIPVPEVDPAEYWGVPKFAANEFAFFFKDATGIDLDVLPEKELKDGAPFISIGNTSQFRESELVYDKTLGKDGVNVFWKKGNIYIIGGSEEGSCYGVYAYLEKVFNLKIFTADLFTIDKNADFTFEKIFISQQPYFPYRCISRGETDRINSPLKTIMRMRVGNMWKLYSTFGHTFYSLISVKEYYDKHPEWFSSYINHGNKPKNEELYQICLTNPECYAEYLKKLKNAIETRPFTVYASVSQNDGNGEPCKCPSCLAIYEKYKRNWSAVYVDFANRISRDLTPWIYEKFPDRAPYFTFSLLGYGLTSYAPVDENGEPIIQCEENVSIQYAPIIGNRATPYLDDEHFEEFRSEKFGQWETGNRKMSKAIKNWRKCCKHVDMWSYGCDMYSGMTPFNMWYTIKQNIIDCKTAGGRLYYEEATHRVKVSNFTELKLYVETRLMWDISLDQNELINDFMQAFYGCAGWKKVREYFDKMNAHFLATKPLDFGKIPETHGGSLREDLYPLEFLNECYDVFNQAVEQNERLKGTDGYQFYQDNIQKEKTVIDFLILSLYGEKIDAGRRLMLVNEFEKYGKMIGLDAISCFGLHFADFVDKYKKM